MSASQYVRSSYQVNATPQFRMLSTDQCESIVNGAMEVLERTGAEVQNQEALQLLTDAGCWVEGNRVRIPTHLIERAIRTAPSRIVLSDREGNRSLFLEGQNVYFGPGGSNTYIIDHETGERRYSTTADTANSARVVDALKNLSFAMDNGVPSDAPSGAGDVHGFRALVENTTKPIVQWGYSVESFKDIVDIASAVAGSLEALQRNPFVVLFAEPSSPLSHTADALDKALFAAKSRIPVVYAPSVFAGESAPSTMAGALVVTVADFFVGLLVGQLASEGAPFIMGGLASTMDMRTETVCYGAVELSLLSAGLTGIARYLKLPSFSSAGCSDSHLIDTQSAAEGAFSLLIASFSGANLVHGLSYLDGGNTGSIDMITMNEETISMISRIMGGVEVSDETLALDAVDRTGPGGYFLMDDHTMAHFREFWNPTLISRMRYDNWAKVGAKSMGERVNDKTKALLADHTPVALSDSVRDAIKAIVDRADARVA